MAARDAGPIRLAASILDSNLANLAQSVRRCVRAGADRIHLDVMDGHFVPNITFGPRTVRALRSVTDLPFDAHLMIANPARFVDEFIAAGCDSITIHVEVEEPVGPVLERIRAAGRLAGLAVKPRTPLAALEPYRHLLDVVMVMTVEPGFGGQQLMRAVAREKLPVAARYLAPDTAEGAVHVDGGVNRGTAELVGRLGAEVLVVGSALFQRSRAMAEEIARIKALAEQGRAVARAAAPGSPRTVLVGAEGS